MDKVQIWTQQKQVTQQDHNMAHKGKGSCGSKGKDGKKGYR